MARYYRADLGRNAPVSTEITGYAVSAFAYLHSVTHDERYLERAVSAARFLTRIAWSEDCQTVPFELQPGGEGLLDYFFDCGIVVRGLLSAWRLTGTEEYLDVARKLGLSMARDFAAAEGDFHPILTLPGKKPLDREALRWSRSAGCYQLKAAMAWWELYEATGDAAFQAPYNRALDYALAGFAAFLPGHPDSEKVMDRLHAFAYFLEGLLPRAREERCAAAMRQGVAALGRWLRAVGPQFERSDVCAQLLRIRLYADWAGVEPLDIAAARHEAGRLIQFQHADSDPRIDGGVYFGRKGATWMPYVNPVSAAFALQALEIWEQCGRGQAQAHRHLLI